jgi:glutaconate CoA-transferase, subunit A
MGRSIFRAGAGAGYLVARLQTILRPPHALQRVGAIDVHHPTLHRAIGSGGVQINVRMRIGPLKARNHAGGASRVLEIEFGRGVMCEECRRGQQDQKRAPPAAAQAWHNHSLAHILPLKQAIQEMVRDGDVVALEGFTHLIPFAAGHEIIRQGRRDLTLIRMTPDLIYDQLIGSGCASKLIFSWGGNPGVGSLHRLRDAVEQGWPVPLALEENAHAGMAAAYAAGASHLPFGVLRGFLGTDLPKYNRVKFIECPFTGEKLAAIPAIRPDVTVIHAQKADRKGNVLMWGVIGVQKEAVLAAKRVIVTVEEMVDKLDAPPNAVVLPSWVVGAVSEVKGGAFPSYAQGYYPRNNAFYKQWDPIARERETFQAWMQKHVLGTKDFDEFKRSLEPVVTHA